MRAAAEAGKASKVDISHAPEAKLPFGWLMNIRRLLIALIIITLTAVVTSAYSPAQSDDELKARFLEAWKLYFGEPSQAAQAGEALQAQGIEPLFREMWNRNSALLDPQEKPAAEAAMRFKVLGDKRGYIRALRECAASRIFSPSKSGAMLYYLFLEETVEESSILPMALPPGENGERFYEAFAQLGEDNAKVRTRLAVFIFRKLVEEKLFRSLRNDLPLMWFSTRGLAPSEALFGRVMLSDGAPFIKGEFNEEASSLKLISVLTDLSGRIVKIGIGNPSDGPVLIPADGNILHLMLFNPGSSEGGQGMSGTVWKDYSVPVSVEESSFSGQFLKLTLRENGAVVGYSVEGADESGRETGIEGLPFARSSGEGVHTYFYSIPPGTRMPGRLLLKAHTFSGFTFTVPIPADK